MFKALEPLRTEVVVDEPGKDNATIVRKFFSCHKKYQHQEPMKDLGISGMTIEEFWEGGDKDYNEFEHGKSLVTKQVLANLMWPLSRLHEWYYLACVCGLQFIEGRIPEAVFKSRSFDLNIELFELHTIDQLRMLDVSLVQSLTVHVPILLIFFMLRVMLATTMATTNEIMVMTISSKEMPFFTV
jgi:hypothetical protein